MLAALIARLDTKDPYFGSAFIDTDEWLAQPFPHRYLHGGFEGTDTLFALYLPEQDRYRGRSLQWLEGGFGGHEGPEAHSADVTAYYLELAASLGAYWVESNQGHRGLDPGPPDPRITTYRASAQTARFARSFAGEFYGSEPHHSYLFGGSGGGMRSILCMENTTGIWHGAVPFVAGDPAAVWSPGRATAIAVGALLGPKLAAVVDAIEPGGAGEPYDDLSPLERSDLEALFASGFPPEALFQFNRPTLEQLMAPQMVAGMERGDPDFVSAFWAEPEYPGGAGELDHRLIDLRGTVREVLDRDALRARGISDHDPAAAVAGVAPGLAPSAVGLVLEGGAPQGSQLATVTVRSETGAETTFSSLGTFEDVLLVRPADPAAVVAISPADAVAVDNRAALAFANYHRHAADRGRRDAPFPLPMLPMTGRFDGKMILVNGTLDASVTLPAGTEYDRLVRKARGAAADSDWRFWLVENAGHVGAFGPAGPPPVLATRLASYRGVVDQALADVVAWVEEGRQPPASTRFELDEGRLKLPASAADRAGLQPVVTATANGGRRADVTVAEPVTFWVEAATPPGGGHIVRVEWDFLGNGDFPFVHDEVDGSLPAMRVSTTHAFAEPGTYFPCVRVTARRRDGGPETLARLENIARVRVVVAAAV